MMKKKLPFLACPNCHTCLEKRSNDLICQKCKKKFPTKNNMAFLLDEDNLDQRKKNEIKAFNDLSSYQELMSRPYFRDLKEKISQALRQYCFKGKTILEIGAGTSDFLSLFDKDNTLIALDINAVLLSQNKAKAHLVVSDAENLPFLSGSFDFVYLVGVLHHLEDQKKALSEIKRVLKENGQFFISEPTQWSLNLPYFLIRKLAIMVLGVSRFKSLSGCGSLDESFVSFKALKEVFGTDFHLKLRKILPLRMPPIKFLEKFFPKRLNNFLERTPPARNLGTIVCIQGMKQRREE